MHMDILSFWLVGTAPFQDSEGVLPNAAFLYCCCCWALLALKTTYSQLRTTVQIVFNSISLQTGGVGFHSACIAFFGSF